MSDADILAAVTKFADEAHGDQMRKYGNERYIVHPIRVMEICGKFNSSLPVLSAAILHDVLEDTPVTGPDLHLFLLTVMDARTSQRTLTLVIELTDVYVKDAYPGMNRMRRKEMERNRLSKVSSEAQTIKYADILDNGRDIFDNDRHFAPRFLKEGALTLSVMTKGDQQLRNDVIAFVENALQSLQKINL